MERRGFLLAFVPGLVAAAGERQTPLTPGAADIKHKIHLIDSGRARRGSTIVFPQNELNDFTRWRLPQLVPQGAREPRIEIGNGIATGHLLVDFLKMRQANGVETPWLISKMIQGERPLTVHARIDSARGHATVHVDSVELSEVTVSGGALDFLINTFFLPVFPEAKINKPFALADGIERIEAVPGQARVVMKR